MRTRSRQTLGGNIPENLIQLERRHSAGRRLRRTDYRPFPMSRCNTRVRFPGTAFKLRGGLRAKR